jgi:hypothetical protein
MLEKFKENIVSKCSSNIYYNILFAVLLFGIVNIFWNENSYYESLVNGQLAFYCLLSFIVLLFQIGSKNLKGMSFYLRTVSEIFIFIFSATLFFNFALTLNVNEKGELYHEFYPLINKKHSKLLEKSDIGKELECYKYSNGEIFCEINIKNKTFYLSEEQYKKLGNPELKFQMLDYLNIDKNNRKLLDSQIRDFKTYWQYPILSFFIIFLSFFYLSGSYLKMKEDYKKESKRMTFDIFFLLSMIFIISSFTIPYVYITICTIEALILLFYKNSSFNKVFEIMRGSKDKETKEMLRDTFFMFVATFIIFAIKVIMSPITFPLYFINKKQLKNSLTNSKNKDK